MNESCASLGEDQKAAEGEVGGKHNNTISAYFLPILDGRISDAREISLVLIPVARFRVAFFERCSLIKGRGIGVKVSATPSSVLGYVKSVDTSRAPFDRNYYHTISDESHN
jgi:hypothetical protein